MNLNLRKNIPFSQDGAFLPLMNSFYTLQGEGFFSGTPMFFIRLYGCDVGCFWCDVKDSWRVDAKHFISVEEIVCQIPDEVARVMITGGEPSVWKLEGLIRLLRARKVKIHIETSGAYEISSLIDWVCLSPKKNKLPIDSAYPIADELKVVIEAREDISFARQQADKVSPDTLLYLQPEWSKRKEVMPSILSFIKENPEWKLSLQLHKYIDIP